MEFEGMSLYLENLLPGIIILGSTLVLLPLPVAATSQIASDIGASQFLVAAFFLAVSYMLGLISSMISRIIVGNLLCDKLTRPLFLSAFSTICFPELKKVLSLPTEHSWIKKWHQAYRAAIATQLSNGTPEARAEIMRRREQGRLVRNLLLPVVIGSCAISSVLSLGHIWAIALGVSILMVLLCSYAEYTTFAEAMLPFAARKPDARG